MTRSLAERRRRVLAPAYRTFYSQPLHLRRGEGVWVEDSSGRRYLDAYNNVPSVGHCNPRVVEAVAAQAAVLNTHTRYLHPGVVAYAEDLLTRSDERLQSAVFTCTGSEANDLALRMARAWHGGTGIIVTSHAYHGVTEALASCSPSLGPVGRHVRTVAAPREDEPVSAFGDRVAAAADDLADEHGAVTLVVDSVMSSDGVRVTPVGALAGAVAAVRERGGLFVADEVQAGFGRLGTLWGYELHGVSPDLVTLGKPMGNGHPIGGVLSRGDVADAFSRRARYFNTFGGNPVSVAAGAAVLAEITDRHLVGRAGALWPALRDGLSRIAQSHPELVDDVRGAGLFGGLALRGHDGSDARELATTVLDRMREAGVLVGRCGPDDSVVKIRPPLVIERTEVDLILATLDEVLARLEEVGVRQGVGP